MKINCVLLVDDERHIRRIAELALQKVGKWTVLLASSGAEALQVAPEQQPDVILLDVMMPGMDGPTVLGELRKNPKTENIPVIFMTAKIQEAETARYIELGAAGVIAKPFDPMLLPGEIRKIIDKP